MRFSIATKTPRHEEILNSNIEIRNNIECSKFECSKRQSRTSHFDHLDIGILNLFRISCFGFRD
ncbi:MAG: hypothetical protein A2Z25_22305 [Planctomycetes bacterium RBG_16_55_9]|nr:MAG: hypothetical protein A2Z25_22305 [Planctomycetes bacterium RBG_16_55_9]